MPGRRGRPVYPIGVVQRLTGLTARQIRYYEQQGLLRPQRTRGNHRLYTPAQVERLKVIRDLLQQGMTTAAVRQWLSDRPDEARHPVRTGHPTGWANNRNRREGTDSPGPTPTEGRRESSRQFDYEQLVIELGRHPQLSSLYPVNNQAALSRLLYAIRGRGDDLAND